MRRLIIAILCLAAAAMPTASNAQCIIRLPGTKATLECYTVDTASRAAIVCPGGSYCWLDYQGEGVEVAKWLQNNGISAYVLRYRVAGWWAWATHYRLIVDPKHPFDARNDAAKAVNYLWDSLGQRNIGIMGFSAGGHLAMMTARDNLRFRWAAPIYPVVSMQAPCTHRRSRRALLGDRRYRNPEWQQAYSLEQQIHSKTPPVFLVACKDDPVVDYHNSILLDSALTTKHIPHRFILYNTGGHGFGVSNTKGTPECHQWKEEFLKWIKEIDK